MERKELGRIQKVSFGFGGYQDAQIGLWLTLCGGSWGVMASVGGGWSTIIKHSEHCQWTEAERDSGYSTMLREVQDILRKAKVEDVGALVGKPIEATFEGMALKSWRILEEVLA